MTDKYDFKGALDEFDLSAVGKDGDGNILFALSSQQIILHRQALRLAAVSSNKNLSRFIEALTFAERDAYQSAHSAAGLEFAEIRGFIQDLAAQMIEEEK